MRSLYRTCAGHTLLPRSLRIELPDSPTGVPLYCGGFGDVWKREYRGQQVAVKVLRTYVNSDLQKITRVSHRRCRQSQSQCTRQHTDCSPAEVLQRVRNVEISLPSECAAAVGSDYVKDPVCDGIGMAAEWEHQPVRKNTLGCKSFRSCMFSVQISSILSRR